MKKIAIFMMVFLFFSFNLILAQDEEAEERDILEVGIFTGLGIPMGGFTDWNDSIGLGASLGWDIGLEVGYFVTSNFVLGFNFTYYEMAIGDNTEDEVLDQSGGPGLAFINLKNNPNDLSHRLYYPSLYLKYYFFGESNLVPYLKGSVGIDNNKLTMKTITNPRFRAFSYSPNLGFGIGAGLFYYTSDYSGLFIEGNFHYSASKNAEKEYDPYTYKIDENLMFFEIHAGVNVYFGSGE